MAKNQFLARFTSYQSHLQRRIKDKEKMALTQYVVTGLEEKLINDRVRMNTILLKESNIQNTIITMVFQPESNDIILQIRDNKDITEMEIRIKRISDQFNSEYYNQKLRFTQEETKRHSPKLLRKNNIAPHQTQLQLKQTISLSDKVFSIKWGVTRQKPLQTSSFLKNQSLADSLSILSFQNLANFIHGPISTSEIFGYVAKVIRNGMYEILEPYHQSFKSETPTPSKTDVRKTLMRELSLRSQDIVSEQEDNIEMFRADRSARKKFKVKRKFKRLQLLQSKPTPQFDTLSTFIDQANAKNDQTKQIFEEEEKLQEQYSNRSNRAKSQKLTKFGQLSPQLGRDKLLDQIEEEDEDTTKNGKRRDSVRYHQIKTFHDAKFGDFLTIKSLKHIVEPSIMPQKTNSSSILSYEETVKDQKNGMFYDIIESSYLQDRDNFPDQGVLNVIKAVYEELDLDLNIDQSEMISSHAYSNNLQVKSQRKDSRMSNNSFQSERISSSDESQHQQSDFLKFKKQVEKKQKIHSQRKQEPVNMIQKDESKSKFEFNSRRNSRKIEIIFENDETISYASNQFQKIIDTESQNKQDKPSKPFFPIMKVETFSAAGMTKELEHDLDDELLNNQQYPLNSSFMSHQLSYFSPKKTLKEAQIKVLTRPQQ